MVGFVVEFREVISNEYGGLSLSKEKYLLSDQNSWLTGIAIAKLRNW